MDGRVCSLHLRLRGQELATPPERMGDAEHQQSQLPDPKEILSGRRGVRQELYAKRRRQTYA